MRQAARLRIEVMGRLKPGASTSEELGLERRPPLTRSQIIEAAIELADQGGLEAVSMRRLGQELGVEAMALYRHVRSKDDFLNGMIEEVVGRFDPPQVDADWTIALRARVMAARRVMLRHPWARRLLEERGTSGPAVMAHLESVLAILLDGGFSLELAHHALHVLSSRLFGFSQDLFDDSGRAQPSPEEAAILEGVMASRYPRITELARSVSHEGVLGRCDDDIEFAFGLDLMVEGLARLRS